MKLCLLDTGPIVALLDAGDPDHASVAQFLSSFRAQLVTTGAVLTESFHLLAHSAQGPGALVELIQSGNVRVEDCLSSEALSCAAKLMHGYADIPMDFADATLVLVAERLSTSAVLTLDERGFRTFRHSRNKPFTLVLQQPSLSPRSGSKPR